MSINRFNALMTLAFAVVMYFFVIPQQIEEPMIAGLVKPDSIPNIAVIGLGLFAFMQFLEKNQSVPLQQELLYKSLILALIGIAGVWLMSLFGFIIIAPLLSTSVMIFAKERRVKILAIGFVMPLIFWYFAEILLNRPLP